MSYRGSSICPPGITTKGRGTSQQHLTLHNHTINGSHTCPHFTIQGRLTRICKVNANPN